MMALGKAVAGMLIMSSSLVFFADAAAAAANIETSDSVAHTATRQANPMAPPKAPRADNGLLGELSNLTAGLFPNGTNPLSMLNLTKILDARDPSSGTTPLAPTETIGMSPIDTPAATPTACGETGAFTLTFDNLPTPENKNSYPPIENPYHGLYFSNGYSYAPPPSDPFKPVSPPKLAVFLPNITKEASDSTDAGLGVAGEVSAGPNMGMNAFWFNLSSVYLGCSEPGPNKCQWDVIGFKYDRSTQSQTTAVRHLFTTPPCAGPSCKLAYTEFPSDFSGLSGVQFFAYVDDARVSFSMDNLSLAWYNTSCAAGLERVKVQTST